MAYVGYTYVYHMSKSVVHLAVYALRVHKQLVIKVHKFIHKIDDGDWNRAEMVLNIFFV